MIQAHRIKHQLKDTLDIFEYYLKCPSFFKNPKQLHQYPCSILDKSPYFKACLKPGLENSLSATMSSSMVKPLIRSIPYYNSPMVGPRKQKLSEYLVFFLVCLFIHFTSRLQHLFLLVPPSHSHFHHPLFPSPLRRGRSPLGTKPPWHLSHCRTRHILSH